MASRGSGYGGGYLNCNVPRSLVVLMILKTNSKPAEVALSVT